MGCQDLPAASFYHSVNIECKGWLQPIGWGLMPPCWLMKVKGGEGHKVNPSYICMDKALTEAGCEPTDSVVGPPSEARLKAAMRELWQP